MAGWDDLVPKTNPMCYIHNGLPWLGIIPPKCTCLPDPSTTITITTLPLPPTTEQRLAKIEEDLAYIKRLLEKLTQ